MRIITLMLLTFFVLHLHAQKTTDQRKTVQIDNENGSLSITFENDQITSFYINNEPVDETRYDDYEEIIANFTEAAPFPPLPPEPPKYDDNVEVISEDLKNALVDYLLKEGIVDNPNKFQIYLKQKFLKVNGARVSAHVHQHCLDIFSSIYDHELNVKSSVKFKKSKNSTSSSVRIEH